MFTEHVERAVGAMDGALGGVVVQHRALDEPILVHLVAGEGTQRMCLLFPRPMFWNSLNPAAQLAPVRQRSSALDEQGQKNSKSKAREKHVRGITRMERKGPREPSKHL